MEASNSLMTIELELTAEMESRLHEVARMQGKAVDLVLLEGVRQHLRRDVLSEPETRLLQAMNAPLPQNERLQRDYLINQSNLRELGESEQSTLVRLIDGIELANATRWQSFADLAELRGVSLTEIAKQLEIPLP